MNRRKKAQASSRNRYLRHIPLALLISLSTLLSLYWMLSYLDPRHDYPVLDLTKMVRYPEAPDASALFVDAPINTKQLIKVSIADFDAGEFSLDATYEIVLYQEDATFTMLPTRFFPYERVRDLKVTLNDQPIALNVAEIKGVKYYFLPEMRCQGRLANKLKVNCIIARQFNYTGLMRAPWPFTKEYSRITHLPLMSAPIKKGNSSENAVVEVHFPSLYYRICQAGGGWVGMYVPSVEEMYQRYEYKIIRGQVVFEKVPVFEYPIRQTYARYDDRYVFTTKFTEDNFADRFTLIFVPDYAVFLFMTMFLFSGYTVWLKKLDARGIWRYILPSVEVYFLPFAFLGVESVRELRFGVNIISEVLKLTGGFSVLIFSYPMLGLAVFALTRRR